MSPTRLFACQTCGHRFEVSRVVANSNVSMTLCPRCGGHEIETIGEGSRESAPRPLPTADQPGQPAAARPGAVEPPAEQPPEAQSAPEPAAGEDAA